MSQQNIQNFELSSSSSSSPPQKKDTKIIKFHILDQFIKRSKYIPQTIRQQYTSNTRPYRIKSGLLSAVMNVYVVSSFMFRKYRWWGLTTNWGVVLNRFLLLYLMGGLNSSREANYVLSFYDKHEAFFIENQQKMGSELNIKQKIILMPDHLRKIPTQIPQNLNQLPMKSPYNYTPTPTQTITNPDTTSNIYGNTAFPNNNDNKPSQFANWSHKQFNNQSSQQYSSKY